MIKAFKRLLALFGLVVVAFGAIKSLFYWLAKDNNDQHEVWSDDEEREDA
jgi:CHASE3 domain sensor protein